MTEERVAPALPEGRRAVLYALRRRGQATADDIARQLDMTVSGARQHLTALVDDGFAEATELPRPPGQRGRAQLAYMVTDRADALFPKAYGELTNELLGYASEADSGLVDTLFARRRDERIRNATERLAPQAHAQGEGRGAHAHPRRRRLPRHVRRRRRPACSASSSTTARSGRSRSATARRARASSTSSAPRSPDADVERVQHMVAGAPHCAYEVRARKSAA